MAGQYCLCIIVLLVPINSLSKPDAHNVVFFVSLGPWTLIIVFTCLGEKNYTSDDDLARQCV